jgi:putative glutamine amidotransferase
VRVIGISVGMTSTEQKVHGNYVEAVLAAGGAPLLIPAVEMSGEQIAAVCERIDALLLTGGGDVHPSVYGAVPEAELDEVSLERDRVEIQLLEAMTAKGCRVLGICRGAQLMAAATGGVLVQDLPSIGHFGHKDHKGGYAAVAHPIKVEPGSLVEDLMNDLDEVNSHHHQSVAEPGRVLVPTAWSDDGIIEALEAPGLLAIQWHPELGASMSRTHRRPFEWLVQGSGRGEGDGDE